MARRIGYQSSVPPSGVIAMLFGNATSSATHRCADQCRPHRRMPPLWPEVWAIVRRAEP